METFEQINLRRLRAELARKADQLSAFQLAMVDTFIEAMVATQSVAVEDRIPSFAADLDGLTSAMEVYYKALG